MGGAEVMLPYVCHQMVSLDFRIMCCIQDEYTLCTCSFTVGIKQVTFSMVIGN